MTSTPYGFGITERFPLSSQQEEVKQYGITLTQGVWRLHDGSGEVHQSPDVDEFVELLRVTFEEAEG